MGRWWGERERPKQRKEKKESGEEGGPKDIWAPCEREDLGWALWPCERFANFKNWQISLSRNLVSGWWKLPNNKGGSCDSRPLPSSLYKRQQRHTWPTSLSMQIYAVHKKRVMLIPKDIQLAHRICGNTVKYLSVQRNAWIYDNKCSYLGIIYLYTQFNAGKNHIPDGSGSGSATVGQLEVIILSYQLNCCQIYVTKWLYQNAHLCC